MAGKVALEVALQDFDRMCKARRIETSGEDWTEEDKKSFEEIRDRVCKHICAGDVIVTEEGDPQFKFGAPNAGPLKLGKPKGSSILAMDGKEGSAKAFYALADISGVSVKHFSGLDLADIRILEDFFILFFARS